MPVISVIIPAYNSENYLRECLDSVAGQEYGDFEVIVVDDGSEDGTTAVVEEYASRDRRFRLVRNSHNGVSASRNLGLSLAGGEWIMFLDSDDCLYSLALGRLLKAASENRCEISVGRFYFGSYPKCCPPMMKGTDVLSSEEAIERMLYQNRADSSPCAKLFHKSVVASTMFEPGLRYEDLDWLYRVYDNADRIAFIHDLVYFYRDHAGSFINSFTPARLDVLKVTERIEGYMQERHPSLVAAARDRRLSANFNMLGLMETQCGADEFVERKEACWALIKKYRRDSLLNPKVRLRNKAGVLVSYLGRRWFRFFAGIIYRR